MNVHVVIVLESVGKLTPIEVKTIRGIYVSDIKAKEVNEAIKKKIAETGVNATSWVETHEVQ